MKKSSKIIVCFILVSIVIISSFTAVSLNISFEKTEADVDLHLLRVEHYLEISANDSTDVFNVKYACPPTYGLQVPVFIEIFEDSDADILSYKIEDDVAHPPNKFVNFTIDGMNKDEHKLIHFTVWVLVKHNDFSDLPKSKKFPVFENLPSETKTWLVGTEVTQKDHFLINLRSKILRAGDEDMISYAKKIAPFIKKHRYLLFLAQLNLRMFLSQDAVTTLLINGENVGRSHLACALFRNQSIPSRVLLVNNDQGFWTQMHYMVEYYVPDYGWVLLDTTKGKTPYNTSRQVINRICYPSDENDTKVDYIFKLMEGEERWIWIKNENVTPYYVDCDQGSKSQMFSENIVKTCEQVYIACFNSTKNMFEMYQEFQSMNLTESDLDFFENATGFQQDAIDSFMQDDIMNYYYNVQRSIEEFNKIAI